MKPFSVIILSILLMGGTGLLRGQTATGGGQAAQQLPAPTAYAVVSQDGDSQVWERTEYEQAPDGSVVARNHDYTEIQSGLNYQDPATGQWKESREEIDIQPGIDGASATQGGHQSYFPGDIFQGMIQEVTPDGLQLQSRPVGLFYADDTNSVLIAILTNSVGELVSSNQIVYPNAFEGADASIRYTYRKAGFEQDVIVQGQLPDPAALGLDPAKTRLGMLTVFFNTNDPVATPGPLDAAEGLRDWTLTFGSMTMGPGRAFSIGDTEPSTPPANATPAQWLNWMTNSMQQASSKGTPTFKHWFQMDGRNYLMEEVPYQRVAAQLSQLPAATARQNVISTKLYAANSFLEAIPARLLSPVTQLSKTKMTRLAQVEQPHGLVLDYQTINGSLTNYTFQGDTTYNVTGPCYFTNITLEGGTVIKYPKYTSTTAYIEVSGTVTCNTSSYRPAVFTAVDDNTVGETISGSTGSPYGSFYADPAIYAPNGFNLSHVRICYADEGVWMDYSGTSSTLSDSQVINSVVMAVLGNGNADYMTLTCNNCLFEGYLYGGVFAYDNGYYYGGDNYYLNNCTIDNAYYLASGTSSSYYIYATNCIFANGNLYMNGSYTLQGGYNGFYNTGYTFGSPSTTSGSSPFQTVGAGSFYLASSTFRGIGTTVVGSNLLAGIKAKTTWPPLLYSNVTISTNITLAPYASRDTNSSPDLGYHYDPVDYLCGGVSVSNANVTVNPGTAIGVFGLDPNNDGHSFYGIDAEGGGQFYCHGLANSPNRIVDYAVVQESRPGTNWFNPSLAAADVFLSDYNQGLSTGATFDFRFTDWSSLAKDARLCYFGNISTINFRDSEFYIGSVLSGNITINFTNCLFYRTLTSLYPPNGSISMFLNNLVYGGQFLLHPWTTGTNGVIKNNIFDGKASTSLPTADGGYNAYINPTWSGPPPYTNDMILTNAIGYQTGPLGTFYQLTNSPLIYVGNTNANLLGLYHYTVTTNLINGLEVPDGTNIVSIGYHYVATDAYGNPLDSNGNGIPDYIEDTNGNGQPLTVTLLTPTNNSFYTEPATIPIQASVFDWSSVVTNVTFYQNSTPVIGITNAPYQYTWPVVAAGLYSVTATAHDTAGSVASSTAATVTVTNLCGY